MLVLDRAQVEALLDLPALIDALAAAMVDLSCGAASVPARNAAVVRDRGAFLAAMPGYLPSAEVLMTKLVSLFPSNEGTSLPTHQAVIVAFDPDTGQPAALMDGTAITAIRTGAGSALSARLLARPEAGTLAVLGTGVQARSHIRAMCVVREISEIRIAGRDLGRAQALASETAEQTTAEVIAVATYEDALRGADIACATTHADTPVVRREWLAAGVHVTSVGFSSAGREVDDATVAAALVYVESRAAALAPHPAGSNDLLRPVRDGVIAADQVHEIGELISGSRPGRGSADQITLYKSVGVAVQDAAAAALVLAAARTRGVGIELPL